MDERIKLINKNPLNIKGKFVVYWVQTGLRIDYNYSLLFSIKKANELNLPLLVVFGLRDNYYWSNLRQYLFLKQGLIEYKKNLEYLGINFFIKKINSIDELINIFNQSAILVCDFGYLKGQRLDRLNLLKKINIPFYEIENDVFIPTRILSSKKVNFAREIRAKIFSSLPYFNKDFYLEELKIKTKIFNQSLEEINAIFNDLKIDTTVKSINFIGGESQADLILNIFLKEKLAYYKKYRSDPSKDFQSNLSPYLHFGFISSVKIVNRVLKKYALNDENVKSFFNELLNWRELAKNFVYYENNYNNWQNLPRWVINSLDKHLKDKRDYLYNLIQLEKGETHDIYWNSAQKEMVLTGKMHNYMRMYWAKKVIEWTTDWRQAYQWLIYLNDKYELDGRDANGYAGIAWSFGQFDHPWFERKIFGVVRYMNDKGLERKFDIKKYVEKIKNLEKIHK